MGANKKNIGPYELGKTLGKGTYSTVKRAVHVETGTEVAMKIMTSSCDIQDIDREIAILKLLKHPNIVTLLDVIHDEETKTTYLAFELVNGGDLFDYTIARGRLSEREARRIMREIVGAIAYCHAHMVVHRDLKLENVLMDKDGHPKIADFGLSGVMKPGLRMNTYCGSPMYMSPEIIQGLGYGPGVDIWSLGVVMYTIVVGMTPWKLTKQNVVEDLDAVLRGEYSVPSHIKLTPGCIDLMSLMLVPNHAKRASIEQIMEHPWLAEGYDQPIRIPISVPDAVPVNEHILKQMVAMGYPYTSTQKVVTDNIPSPALMVYQRMLQQLEEEEAFPPAIIHGSPHKTHARRASANAVLSPRSIAMLDTPVQLRVISDPKRAVKAKRRSCEIPAQFLQAALQSPPPATTRPTLTSSWRVSQMSTISEEAPVEVATENAQDVDPITILHRKLPQLRLTPHHSSAPNSPRSPPILSPFTEEIPIVRGAFNVATTTLKPRRALLEEIGRVLAESGIEYSMQRTTFECAVGEGEKKEKKEKPARGYFDDDDEDEEEKKKDEDEDTTFGRLRFDIEVCRVAGLEMLLAVRFRRVVGNSWEYQEICKNLMAKMKL